MGKGAIELSRSLIIDRIALNVLHELTEFFPVKISPAHNLESVNGEGCIDRAI